MRWNILAHVAKFDADIDGYRRRHGKEIGEARFFLDHQPFEVQERRGNMLLIAGASLVWDCLTDNGTATAGQTSTFLNSSNAYIAVGDGGLTPLSGAATVTNGATTCYFGLIQTGLSGVDVEFGSDPGGVYRIVTGGGSAWTLDRNYAGPSGSTTCSPVSVVVDTQTDLQAPVNKARQVVDAGYPLHIRETGQAITGATNATPIVVTCTNGYSNGDFVCIKGVRGNTAANDIWQISSVSGTAFTLNNSVGNGSYTSGGVASRSRVLVLQATFGANVAGFSWREWGIANGSAGGTLLNRRAMNLGTKPAAATWSPRIALALS